VGIDAGLRDTEDLRSPIGVAAICIDLPKLWLVNASPSPAHPLGGTGEVLGCNRMLKANTGKRGRVHGRDGNSEPARVYAEVVTGSAHYGGIAALYLDAASTR
jgi:hypothetical protein